MEKKEITKMTKAILDSKFVVILDHDDATWDEHMEILGFYQEYLRWQRFLAFSLSLLSKMITVLEIALVKPLPLHLYGFKMSLKLEHNMIEKKFINHKMYTKEIKSNLSSFQCLVTYHMETLFDRDRRDCEGRRVLRLET